MNKKYIIIIIFIFSITIPVNALELCTPTKEYRDYQKLSKEEKAKYQEPIFCSEIVNNNSNNSILSKKIFPKTYSSVSDSSYNSFTAGYTTLPKNQYQTGLCWDFSAISTVESNASVKGLGTLDLSEAHLAYSLLGKLYTDEAGQKVRYDAGTGDGGKITYAPSYFYGGFGQLTENELSFTSKLNAATDDIAHISSSTYPKGRDIVTLDNFYLNNYGSSGACSATDISTIKQNILTYGSVQATMYMDQSLFTDSSENYYLSTEADSEYSNHGVVIVGWDDTISKTKFNGATRDGAWIIKNSWGTSWSDDGFFYISYDDEIICSLVANYEVSNVTKSYDHTYKSSPVIGIPLLSFSNTIYLSSKFSKDSTNTDVIEQLEKVSISVGQYMNYTVYLSKDNKLNDSSNWIELSTGSSNLYGIKSIDLSNSQIINDYTIIVKYDISSSKTSSVFMTCDYLDDTANLDYNTKVNYLSEDGSTWHDMASLSLNGTSLKCKPNTYVYTNEVPQLKITNTSQDENEIVVDVKMVSLDTNKLVYKVLDSNNEDVTSHFTITPDYTNKKITLISDNKISGTYTFKIEYESLSVNTTFQLTEVFEVKDETKVKISDDKLYAVVANGKILTYETLMSNFDAENITIIVKNINNEEITTSNATIGTGYTLIANSNSYDIIVIGDATSDGKINSADLLRIVKYLKGTTTLTPQQLSAADATNDNKVNSADLLRIVKYLKGTSSITMRG